MPPRRIKLHPEAIAEAAAAHDWYANRSPSAAQRFVDELDVAIERILQTPDRWPAYLRGTRRYLLHRFPYIVVYRECDDSVIEIVAVAHGRRRPGYWRRR